MSDSLIALAACGLLALSNQACVARSYNTGDGPKGNDEGRAESGVRFFGLGGVAPFGLLRENTPEARGKLAANLEKTYADVLGSSARSSRALKVQVRFLLDALRSPGSLPCDEASKVTVYRGHGIGALPATRDGGRWAPSDALFDDPPDSPTLALEGGRPVARGESWEAIIDRSWTSRNIDLRKKHDAFASSDAFDAVNRKSFGVGIDAASFQALAERHSWGSWGSPLISTSLTSTIAAAFRAPFLRIRTCLGRALPTSLAKFSSEKELLVFGLVLPEEIAQVQFSEESSLTRATAEASRKGSAPAGAIDAASSRATEKMLAFLEAEKGRTPSALEACFARYFEAETPAKALDRLLDSIDASPRSPAAGFLAASADTCGSP